MAERKELKSLLTRRGDAKIDLKLNVQKTIHKKILNIHSTQSRHFKAYRWGKSGNSGRIFYWAPKITMHLDCSHKIKTHLLPGRKKGYEKLGGVLKSRDSLCYSGLKRQNYDFSSNHLQMCYVGHKKGWMAKNWAFELWCFSRFLRVAYTTRRSNQSIWQEINQWPLLSQLRHLLMASRWKEWMLPLQKCLTMAAPSKEFVAPPLEEAQKGWRHYVPWVPWYTHCILPSSIGGQGRGILGPGGGGWLRDPLGPPLT